MSRFGWLFPTLLSGFILHTQSADGLLEKANTHYQAGGQLKEAIQNYRKALVLAPERLDIRARLCRTLLRDEQVSEAMSCANNLKELHPEESLPLSILGEVFFRKSMFDQAQMACQEALKRSPDLARGHLCMAKVLLSASLFRSAEKHLETAYQLAPDDPEILYAWLWNEADPETRQLLLDRYLELDKNIDPEKLRAIRLHLAVARQLKGTETWTIESAPETRLRLRPIRRRDTDPSSQFGLALPITIAQGKKKKRLLLKIDTGATGVLVRERSVRGLDLRILGEDLHQGFGEEEWISGKSALVDRVGVGELEFKNAVFTLVPSASFGDGLIGTDVFRNFLVTLDYSTRALILQPHPHWLQSDAEEVTLADRKPPLRSTFFPVRRIGDYLFLEGGINASSPHYFLLDSGAYTNILNTKTALELGDLIRRNRKLKLRGAAGSIDEAFLTAGVQLRFDPYIQERVQLVSVDLTDTSRSFGIEVSGLLGHPILKNFSITIDYLSGFVEFKSSH